MLTLFVSIFLFVEIVTGNYEDDFEDSEEEDKKDNKVHHKSQQVTKLTIICIRYIVLKVSLLKYVYHKSQKPTN